MDDKIITAYDLQQKLNKREDVFILDVRPLNQRNEWQIAGSYHVDAYESLNAGDYTVLDFVDIPANTTVVTVCAAGRTSLIASKELRKRGIDAYSLQGGMKAWNYAWNSAEINVRNAKIIQVRRAAKGVLSYVVGSLNEAVVIDAAIDPEVYQQIAQANGWVIKYGMDTHVHADFVSRTKDLEKAFDATHLMIDRAKVDFEYVGISPNESVRVGNARVTFLHTPGHTWESTTFKLDEDAVFTGDTLFIDGIGRPDLKANESEAIEKAKALRHSLIKILSLNPDTIVLPAHTSNSIHFDSKPICDTLKSIKSRIQVADFDESHFVDYALSRIPPTPPNYLTISGINRKGALEGYVLADLEAGGNHCALSTTL